MTTPTWTYHDGGRAAAGYRGTANDCVTRAISIATGLPYQQIYDALDEAGQNERQSKRRKSGRSSARTGIYKPTTRRFLTNLGWSWTPTMQIGQGCKTHLRREELPAGRIIVQVSKHVVAMIDGMIYDTHDPSRNGTRCVYGYYSVPRSK
jgi:hypothetical protein